MSNTHACQKLTIAAHLCVARQVHVSWIQRDSNHKGCSSKQTLNLKPEVMKWCSLQLLLFGRQGERIGVWFKKIITIMVETGEAPLWQKHFEAYVAKSSMWFYLNNYVPRYPERQKWIPLCVRTLCHLCFSGNGDCVSRAWSGDGLHFHQIC